MEIATSARDDLRDRYVVLHRLAILPVGMVVDGNKVEPKLCNRHVRGVSAS